MSLRDRYIKALVARLATEGSRVCSTQPTPLLHVAPSIGVQHETTDSWPAVSDPVVSLHATERAADARQVQPSTSTPAMSDTEVVTFDKRVARSIWLGYADAEGRAGRLLYRDRSGDHRRLCPECTHARTGWRCAKGDAFLTDQLQDCPFFKEHRYGTHTD